MARRGSIGLYREISKYVELIDKDIDGFVLESPVFSTTEKPFKFKFSNGQGLSKEEFHLFQGWIEESGNYVIETNVNIDFNKGDKLIIEGGDNLIDKVVVIIKTGTRLRGNKIDRRKVRIIFCG